MSSELKLIIKMNGLKIRFKLHLFWERIGTYKVSVLIYLCTTWQRSISLLNINIFVMTLTVCMYLFQHLLIQTWAIAVCILSYFINLVTFVMQENIEQPHTIKYCIKLFCQELLFLSHKTEKTLKMNLIVESQPLQEIN